eukprot:435056-Rhodomonas_salina.1
MEREEEESTEGSSEMEREEEESTEAEREKEESTEGGEGGRGVDGGAMILIMIKQPTLSPGSVASGT